MASWKQSIKKKFEGKPEVGTHLLLDTAELTRAQIKQLFFGAHKTICSFLVSLFK